MSSDVSVKTSLRVTVFRRAVAAGTLPGPAHTRVGSAAKRRKTNAPGQFLDGCARTAVFSWCEQCGNSVARRLLL